MEIDSPKSKVILYHYLCFHFFQSNLWRRLTSIMENTLLRVETNVNRAEILWQCYQCIQELFVQILRHSMEQCLHACTTLNSWFLFDEKKTHRKNKAGKISAEKKIMRKVITTEKKSRFFYYWYKHGLVVTRICQSKIEYQCQWHKSERQKDSRFDLFICFIFENCLWQSFLVVPYPLPLIVILCVQYKPVYNQKTRRVQWVLLPGVGLGRGRSPAEGANSDWGGSPPNEKRY